MARVLHDFVAHELTGMLLEVQAGQATAYDPEQYRALLGRLEESGLRALEQMDRTLHALRDAEEQSRQEEQQTPGRTQEAAQVPTRVYGVADLPDLTARFIESSAIPTEVDLAEDLMGGALEAGAAGNGWRVAGTLPIAPVVRTPSAPQ
ncbi:histidine kinase dimerization/phosphoacceptor domain-containing protein [Streptomyces sp. bgisy084]|uniref:histidine kinase dimerization/phosphoacceptor domain-containing protein n=1 Tax=unclassified Streptomyces TaxID=2593676 RepID=UPI003D727C0E